MMRSWRHLGFWAFTSLGKGRTAALSTWAWPVSVAVRVFAAG
jgi:hypothetical protein